mgnify:CR=1 FL=1
MKGNMTKKVRCFKCGRVEEVPAEQVLEGMPETFEQAEKFLVRGESVPGWLCDKCTEALKAFRARNNN